MPKLSPKNQATNSKTSIAIRNREKTHREKPQIRMEIHTFECIDNSVKSTDEF